MFCESCGSQLVEGSNFCTSCGSRVGEVQQSTQMNNQAQAYPLNYQANSQPLSVGQFLGMILLLVIPLVNIILLFVWGFGDGVNINKKNFARAHLILIGILIGLWIVFGVIIGGLLAGALYGY